MARVLHIEDDPRNRLLVRKLLAADGHEVIDAEDGLEGVRLAQRSKPDLILVDINIPGLDGYEVALRLRSEPELERVPIVAITAEGDRETSLVVGCDGFIQKPIEASQFGELINGYLEGRKELPKEHSSNHRLRAQSGRIVVHLEEKVAELSAANARLREMERLRREFYRNISHELATPMTPIVGYLKMLIDQELGDVAPAQSKALKAMDDCVQRLRGTLDNLVDVTALEMGKIKFFYRNYDFAKLVRAAIANTASGRESMRQLVLESIPPGPMVAYGDSDKLLRAVGHLLDNASKFSPEGGSLGIAINVRSDSYELVVVDDGPGIREGFEERVFEPFFQVDGSPTRAQGGVGLGLAIARGVARGLGGDIAVARGAVIGSRTFTGARVTLKIAKNAHQATHA